MTDLYCILIYSISYMSNLYYFVCSVGAIYLIKTVYLLLKNVYRMLHALDLPAQYGKKSWVVITGASDGIGQCFCRQFAELGFNICLISRTVSKLEAVAKKLRQLNTTIQTKIISVDFTKSIQDPAFFDKISKQLEGLDISILVNNVGLMPLGHLHQTDEQEIINSITVNCVPIVMLSKKIIPMLIKHKQKTGKRAGIINLSSHASTIAVPKGAIYNATKAFDDFFSRSITAEFKGVLDILTLRPLLVTSPMTLNKSSILYLKAQTCAHAALRHFGLDEITMGHWWHRLQGWVTHRVPQPIADIINAQMWAKIVDFHQSQKKTN